MNRIWNCPQCGGNSKYFSQTSLCYKCSDCGYEIHTIEEEQEEINYHRDMALAEQYLRVGSWNEAIETMKPYVHTHPSDKKVYFYLIAALTKGFEDLLIDNPSAYNELVEYWDRLERLGCVTSTMQSYYQRRIARIRDLKSHYNSKKQTILLVNILLSLTALILVICGSAWSIVFIIGSIVGWKRGIDWITNNKVINR